MSNSEVFMLQRRIYRLCGLTCFGGDCIRFIDADKLKADSDITNWDKPYGCSFQVIDSQPTIMDISSLIKEIRNNQEDMEKSLLENNATDLIPLFKDYTDEIVRIIKGE